MASASSARCNAAPAAVKPGIGGAARSCACTARAIVSERSATCARRLEGDGCMRCVKGSVQLRHGSADRHAQLRLALRCTADARGEDAEQPQHLALHEWSPLANPECVERTFREDAQLAARFRIERRQGWCGCRSWCRLLLPLARS